MHPAVASAGSGSGEAGFALLLIVAAGAVAGTATLPGDTGQMVALGVVVLLGVPHGALDAEVARPLLRPHHPRTWFLRFALPYLALAAAVLVAWRAAPLATLAAFLAVSVWHFGSEDAGAGRAARHGGAWRALEVLARGGLPIALPALLHPDAVAELFAVAAGVPLPELPPWWAAGAGVWAAIAAAWCIAAVAARRWSTLAEVALLAAAFAAVPPLAAFALYFVCLHAPRHLRSLARDPSRAPRVVDLASAARLSLPATALTFCLGAGLWPAYAGATPDRLLALVVQGLAALTLPHVLLDLWLDRRGPAATPPGR